MSKYLIVTPGYPSLENPYNNAFVHARVKNYVRAGLVVDVLSYNRFPRFRASNQSGDVFDGVNVERGSLRNLEMKVKSGQYDKVLVHFAFPKAVGRALKADSHIPVVVWCHGVDVVSWRRRTYNLSSTGLIKFVAYMVVNTLQRMAVRWYNRFYADRLTFVFVSQWLADIFRQDVGCPRHSRIIPNVIDESVFPYRQKKAEDRLRIMNLRAYASRNYANDVMVEAITRLAGKPYFSELSFSLYGAGKLWDRTIEPLRKYTNVKLENRFLSTAEIVTLHANNGVALMPSRQDTQGVSTCEAMSSGLVPVTSDNSAIPEYVKRDCGYLADDAEGLAAAIDDLYHKPDKFLIMSKRASESVHMQCGSSVVLEKEMDIIVGCHSRFKSNSFSYFDS